MRGILWGGVIMAGLTAAQLAAAHPPTGNVQHDDVAALIESVRAATLRFEDVNVALVEGYIPDPAGQCVTEEAHGIPPNGVPWVSTTCVPTCSASRSPRRGSTAPLGLGRRAPQQDNNGLLNRHNSLIQNEGAVGAGPKSATL